MSEDIIRMRGEDIQLQAHAKDWKDALALAARPLIERGDIDEGYITSMIEAVEKLGPYIVIAPGLALGHARPNESVHAPCIAIATLDEPVEFGSKDNDPVDIVVVLAAVDDNAHIALLQKMVLFLNEEGAFKKLRTARTRQEAQDIADAINKEA